MSFACCMMIGSGLLAGCHQTPSPKASHNRPVFTHDILLKTTPVKDQGKSSLCWVYAMLATLETEHLMQGDSVNLSADFVARAFLREQIMENSFISSSSHAALPYTTRGTLPMLLQLIQTYGLTHEDAYHLREKSNYHILCRRLSQMSQVAGSRRHTMEEADSLLDEYLRPVPRHVFMNGAEYTVLEFAHSVCRRDEYDVATSFSHHPFFQRFPLEIPDNRYHSTFLNLPIDTLMNRINQSLLAGHPVCWEGDVSEKGFSFRQGIARLRDENHVVTQQERQQLFEQGKTTDDHCMAIVGMAHDAKGIRYYVMKNSWGTKNVYGGFLYMSENYLRQKTIAVAIRNRND